MSTDRGGVDGPFNIRWAVGLARDQDAVRETMSDDHKDKKEWLQQIDWKDKEGWLQQGRSWRYAHR